MTVRSVNAGRALLFLWGSPEESDVALVERAAARARAGTSDPLLLVSIHDGRTPVPSSSTRQRLLQGLPRALQPGDRVHVLVLGHGLETSVKRTMLRAMTVLLGQDRVILHRTSESLVAALRPAGLTAADLAIVVRELGTVST